MSNYDWNMTCSDPMNMQAEERAFFLAAGDLLSMDDRKAIKEGRMTMESAAQSLRFSPAPDFAPAPPRPGAASAPAATPYSGAAPAPSANPAPAAGGFFAPAGFSDDDGFGARPQPSGSVPRGTPVPGGTPSAGQRAVVPADRGSVPAVSPMLPPALSVNIKEKNVQLGRKTLLRDVAFDVSYGEFLLILGGSGAGKTTLVRSILGESKANGKILLDGADLYENFKKVKVKIGLVPQFLTLRVNDTVWNTVMDAARIKLSRAFSSDEISTRVKNVLEKVGITELSHSRICDLSGGQKKKVAVAVQLVGFQQVFICDEPDSGLDAASRQQLMDVLKEISETGKVVMVITHYPDDAIDLFSKVIVIAKSSADKAGHLAYAGNVSGAMNFFNVSCLQDIMKEINPAHEGGKGKADTYIQKYVSTVRR